ncbi:MAG: DUF4270 family protein [Cyclobacteriaceae bacterium]|nr:DUF4270 family protein [Cyclobacteriaceae bacterium]
MNLLGKSIQLLLLLVAAFFISSCDDETINEAITLTESPNVNVKFVEIDLSPRMILRDSVNTTSPNFMMVGKLNDPIFGETTANHITQLRPSFREVFPGTDATVDSVTFQLKVSQFESGGFNTPQIYQFRSISSVLDASRQYYNLSEVDVDESILFQGGALIGPQVDSTVQINVPIEFAQNLVSQAASMREDFFSESGFTSILPGLEISPSQNNSGIVKFSRALPDSFMKIYYSSPGDTISANLEFFFTDVINFNQVKVDRTSTPLSNLTQGNGLYEPIDGKIYSQAGTGLYVHLDFQQLFEFIEDVPRFAVNQAQLIFGPVESRNDASVLPPQAVNFLYLNDENRRIRIGREFFGMQSENARQNGAGSTRNILLGITGNANSDITFMLQSLVDGAIPHRRMKAVPVDNNSSSRAYGMDIDNVKLQLYYTEIN